MTTGFHVFRHPGAAEPCATVDIGGRVLACIANGSTLATVVQTGMDVDGRRWAIVRCVCGCGHTVIALAEQCLAVPRTALTINILPEWGRA